MARLRVHEFSLSLDGYRAGANQSINSPLGEQGLRLHEWIVPTKAFRRMEAQTGADRQAWMTTMWPGASPTSAPRSWVGTCSDPSANRGPMTLGPDGGDRIRHTTILRSCSRTTRAIRSRWKAARHSTSSLTESSRPSSCVRRSGRAGCPARRRRCDDPNISMRRSRRRTASRDLTRTSRGGGAPARRAPRLRRRVQVHRARLYPGGHTRRALPGLTDPATGRVEQP
jgi:hypothetical protein